MKTNNERVLSFLETLEGNNILSDNQHLLVMGGDKDPTSGTNNCQGGNCFIGCGVFNLICPNFVTGCSSD